MPDGFGLVAAEAATRAEPSAWPPAVPPDMCWEPRPAGRRYQGDHRVGQAVRPRPEVKRATEQAVAKLDQLSGQAADKLQAARQSTRTEAGEAVGSRSP